MTTYTAVLSGNSLAQTLTAEFPNALRILDCVKWAEAHGQLADRCDIYSESGTRVAQYRRPQPGSYAEACGVWVNAKIYQP
jgi:hypothetical protein